ncbi:hypothetical protein Bca4012_073261 [Brassica carinata]
MAFHSEEDKSEDYLIKIVLIGDCAVRTSNLLARFARDEILVDVGCVFVGSASCWRLGSGNANFCIDLSSYLVWFLCVQDCDKAVGIKLR